MTRGIKEKNDRFIISGLGAKYIKVPDGRYVMECDLWLHNYLEEHPAYYLKEVNGQMVESDERVCLADRCYIGQKDKAA